MFYILNNNVEDVSVGGIFNLLDFIFNEYHSPYSGNARRKESSTGLSNYPKRKRLGDSSKFNRLSPKMSQRLRKKKRVQLKRKVRRRPNKLTRSKLKPWLKRSR